MSENWYAVVISFVLDSAGDRGPKFTTGLVAASEALRWWTPLVYGALWVESVGEVWALDGMGDLDDDGGGVPTSSMLRTGTVAGESMSNMLRNAGCGGLRVFPLPVDGTPSLTTSSMLRTGDRGLM